MGACDVASSSYPGGQTVEMFSISPISVSKLGRRHPSQPQMAWACPPALEHPIAPPCLLEKVFQDLNMHPHLIPCPTVSFTL